MAKINLQDATSLTNEQSFVSLFNENNAIIETASDLFLSRNGTSPNTMEADLDMNSNQIINCGDLDMNGNKITGLDDAVDDDEPVTLGQLTETLEDFTGGSSAFDTTLIREKLTADRTYYIRTDGSDSNTGLTNTAGGAFLTVQKAINTMYTLDLNGYGAYIQVGAGTFDGNIDTGGSILGAGGINATAGLFQIMITGADAVGGTILTSSSAATINVSNNIVVLKNLELQAASVGMYIYGLGTVYFDTGVRIGTCGNVQIAPLTGGSLFIFHSYKIVGGGYAHMYLTGSCLIQHYDIYSEGPAVCTGTLTFNRFMYASGGAYYEGNAGFDVGGATVTGYRYIAEYGGILYTLNSGRDYFPGNTPGYAWAGGTYDGSGTPELLLANRTYYVRTDGNDNNDGRSNTAGGAFRNIQTAVNVASLINMNGYNITIQVGNGTYNEDVKISGPFLCPSLNSYISLIGDATPSNVVINGLLYAYYAYLYVYGFKLIDGGSQGYCLRADSNSYVDVDNCEFGAASVAQIRVEQAGVARMYYNYKISGSAPAHIQTYGTGAFINYRFNGAMTVTLTGTPAFSTAYAVAAGGYLEQDSSLISFSGSATGSRYAATNNGTIYTAGAGATFLPGNAGGSTSAGGLYV